MPIGRNLKWLFIGGAIVRLNRQAKAAFSREEYLEALRLLLKAERRFSWYEVTWHNLGNVFVAMHKDEDAEKALRRAIELKPGFVEAMNDLAALLVRKGRKEEAEAILRKAIETNPKYPYAHVNLGRILINKGGFTEAEVEFKKALESKDLDENTRAALEEELAL